MSYYSVLGKTNKKTKQMKNEITKNKVASGVWIIFWGSVDTSVHMNLHIYFQAYELWIKLFIKIPSQLRQTLSLQYDQNSFKYTFILLFKKKYTARSNENDS